MREMLQPDEEMGESIGGGGGSHSVVGQLQCNLKEGVRADATLLDLFFAKVSEDQDVYVHIVGERLSRRQRLRDLLLTLRHTYTTVTEMKEQPSATVKQLVNQTTRPALQLASIQRGNPVTVQKYKKEKIQFLKLHSLTLTNSVTNQPKT